MCTKYIERITHNTHAHALDHARRRGATARNAAPCLSPIWARVFALETDKFCMLHARLSIEGVAQHTGWHSLPAQIFGQISRNWPCRCHNTHVQNKAHTHTNARELRTRLRFSRKCAAGKNGCSEVFAGERITAAQRYTDYNHTY